MTITNIKQFGNDFFNSYALINGNYYNLCDIMLIIGRNKQGFHNTITFDHLALFRANKAGLYNYKCK